MKHQASVWLAAVAVGACMSACAKKPEPAAEAANTQQAPAPGETTANAGGTTTYYGAAEEQAQQPANN